MNPWVPGPEELSREELLALLAARDASDVAKDARIDALLVTVGDLTAQVQALVLKLGKDSSLSGVVDLQLGVHAG